MYLISAYWWRLWCDYVNFQGNLNVQSQTSLQEVESSVLFYEKPGIILNKSMFEPDSARLK